MHATGDTPTHPGHAADAVEALRADVVQVLDDVIGVVNELRADVDGLRSADTSAIQRRITTLELRMPEIRAMRAELRTELDTDRVRAAITHMSRIHPKRRTVVFAGRDYFGDNLKYAYLAALDAARTRGFDCWYLPFDAAQERIVTELGGACFPADAAQWSAAHMSAALEAAVFVVCTHLTSHHHPNPYAGALFAGARWVQLWHGISIKEVGLRNQVGIAQLTPHFAELLASCGSYAAFVGASDAAEPEWRRWFSFRRYAAIGYPRNDVLLREPAANDLVNVDLGTLAAMREVRARGARTFLYTPTFRDGHPGWVHEIGLDRLGAELAARGDRLVVNLHPFEQSLIPALREQCPQVSFVREQTDLYPLLRESSVLVTDYSSLMFDFLMLDRPIVFFRPDHERYVSGSRTLYDAKVRQLPGPTAQRLDDLLALLNDANEPAFTPIRHELRDRLFDHVDANAGDRLIALLDSELDTALATPPYAAPAG